MNKFHTKIDAESEDNDKMCNDSSNNNKYKNSYSNE